jgi:hypothetical protein
MLNKKDITLEDHLRINENLNRYFEKSLSPEEKVDIMKAQIENTFAKGLIDEETKDKALEQLDNLLEKAGEGSKGGKIIGHTKSGKPIYDTFNHPAHKDFTKEDHRDAATIFDDKEHKAGRNAGGDYTERDKHRKNADFHWSKFDKMKE